jgi:hypothetical protein
VAVRATSVTLVTEPPARDLCLDITCAQGSIQRAAGPGSDDVLPAEKEDDAADEEEQEE